MQVAPEYAYYVERLVMRPQDATVQPVLEQVHAGKFAASESVSEADLTLLADAAQVPRESVLAVRDAVVKDKGLLDVPGGLARYGTKMPTQDQIAKMPPEAVAELQVRVAQRVAAFRAVQAAAATEARKKVQAEGLDEKPFVAKELEMHKLADLAHEQAVQAVETVKQAGAGHGVLWWVALVGAGWLVLDGTIGLLDD